MSDKQTEEPKIVVYALTHNGSTLYDNSLKSILETLRIEIEENCEFAPFDNDDTTFDFELSVTRDFTQTELENMGEFDGF